MANKSVRTRVETILARYPESRNNDKRLVLAYWSAFDNVPLEGSVDDFIKGFILDATPMESITRARRLIQEEGRYLPTDETVVARRSKKTRMEEAVRNREVV